MVIINNQYVITNYSLEECLEQLKNVDSSMRVRAFFTIMGYPQNDVLKAWNSNRKVVPTMGGELDCFERAEVILPKKPIICDRAFVTVISDGYENMLLKLIKSLKNTNNLVNCKFIIFCVGKKIFAKVKNYSKTFNELIPVNVIAHERISASIKGVVYSCSRWINAKSIIALESDMICLTSFEPVWKLIENSTDEDVFGVRPQINDNYTCETIVDTILSANGNKASFNWTTGDDTGTFWFNGGLIAGKLSMWKKLDELLCSIKPKSLMFIEGAFGSWYTEECLMNWAIGKLKPHELSPGWNTQFYETKIEELERFHKKYNSSELYIHDDKAKVLHFASPSRQGDNSVMKQVLERINNDK